MKYLLVLLLALGACRTGPTPRSPATAGAPSLPDSLVQDMLTFAATDFHEHSNPLPARFRDVRLGYVATAGGDLQYRLCGEFLSAQEGRAEWTPFVTIRTDPYEQWLGRHAKEYCRDAAMVWAGAGDLSSALQRRLESMP